MEIIIAGVLLKDFTTVAWFANYKMVWFVLLRPLRPELDGQDLA
jgi:hypothetical protein